MMFLERTSREAGDLELALGGAPASRASATLAAFAGRFAGLESPEPASARVEAGRSLLLQAVCEAARGATAAGPVARRARSVSLTAAAVAGGGLLVASAARGTTPAEVVRDLAGDMAVLSRPIERTTPTEAQAVVTVEGVVTESSLGRAVLATAEGHVEVRLAGSSPLEQGATVRVAGVREGGAVRARTIDVIRPAAAPAGIPPEPSATQPAGAPRPLTGERTPEPTRPAPTPEPTRPAAAVTPAATQSPTPGATTPAATRPVATPSTTPSPPPETRTEVATPEATRPAAPRGPDPDPGKIPNPAQRLLR